MICFLILLLCLVLLGIVLVQFVVGVIVLQVVGLDLMLLQVLMCYFNDLVLQQDLFGIYYGDKSGLCVYDNVRIVDVIDDKVKVFGSFIIGIGYLKNGGNSYYNVVMLNLSKNYMIDEGKIYGVNFNIYVSEGKGLGFFGLYGGYYGCGLGYWDYLLLYGW